jgi:GNAT superfamily N-acetyltransferase
VPGGEVVADRERGQQSSRAFLIRRAVEEDAETLARLSATLGYGADGRVIRDRLPVILASDSDLLIVAADSSGRVVGWLQACATHRLQSGPGVEITGLVVDQGLRRCGVGVRLVAEAERWAKGRSAEGMVVRSNLQRVESHCFYPALGFDRDKTQAVYQKDLRDRA